MRFSVHAVVSALPNQPRQRTASKRACAASPRPLMGGVRRHTGVTMYKGCSLCRNVQYEIAGELGEFGYCHCTSCRKASGSAHAANAPIERAQFRLVSGAGTLREFESSPGKFKAFCSQCDSLIYAYLAASVLSRADNFTKSFQFGEDQLGSCNSGGRISDVGSSRSRSARFGGAGRPRR